MHAWVWLAHAQVLWAYLICSTKCQPRPQRICACILHEVFFTNTEHRLLGCTRSAGSASRLRGLVQTIFGKINVIVTLGGEGVIGHDAIKLQWTQYHSRLAIGESYQNSVTFRGGEGGGKMLMSQ